MIPDRSLKPEARSLLSSTPIEGEAPAPSIAIISGMRIANTIAVGVALIMAAVAGPSGQTRAAKPYVAPRTVGGQPDMQGVWANNNMTPLERPKQFQGRATMTDQELADLKTKVKALLD